MLHESEARLISGIRSSHSRPSGASWPWPWSCGMALVRRGTAAGMSFIPQIGQVPGSVYLGCMGSQ